MIQIGTSGWSYRHWRDNFYNGSSSSLLEHYATRFNTVEINTSFYHLPQESTFDRWRETTPAHFIFAVKAPRFITHMKQLVVDDRYMRLFLNRVDRLKEKEGPILFQVPPRLKLDLWKLERFTLSLPLDHTYVFEFRNPTWYTREVFNILSRANMHLCIHDMKGIPSPLRVVGEVSYVRFHGSDENNGGYSDRMLRDWALHTTTWSITGKRVFCYFNNDGLGWAPKNAATLIGLTRDGR